jgi:hypothetical protein
MQAAGDPKVPFHFTSPHDLDLAHGFKYELFIILVLAENYFLNEVIFMPQHQYVRGLLDSARKKFWMINQFSISRYFRIQF